VTGAEQRLQETPLPLPERLRQCPRPPLLVDKRPHLKPRAQALPRVRRSEPTDQRQVLEQLVQPSKRDRKIGRVDREGTSADRGHDTVDRGRLDTMHLQDDAVDVEGRRRNVRPQHTAISRKPDPTAKITLRLRRHPHATDPGRRAGTDVRGTADHRLEREVILQPALERAHADATSQGSLRLRLVGAKGRL
jgi:hypothetical protein